MNKKIVLFVVLLAGTGLGLGVILTPDPLYTSGRIVKLSDLAAERLNYDWQTWEGEVRGCPPTLSLGSLLVMNIYTGEPGPDEDYIIAGMYTPESHKKGWRTMLAKNPQLAYESLKLFGGMFIQRLNRKMLNQRDSLRAEYQEMYDRGEDVSTTWSYYKYYFDPSGELKSEYVSDGFEQTRVVRYTQRGKRETEFMASTVISYVDAQSALDSLNRFTTGLFWKRQLALLNRYDNLAQQLLKQDDRMLSTFFISLGKEQEYGHFRAWELQEFLVKHGFISNFPYKSEDYSEYYITGFPVDFLLLTYRVNKDYPEWTYRKFLTETRKFIAAVRPYLEAETRK
jgi:hypothetical protein